MQVERFDVVPAQILAVQMNDVEFLFCFVFHSLVGQMPA